MPGASWDLLPPSHNNNTKPLTHDRSYHYNRDSPHYVSLSVTSPPAAALNGESCDAHPHARARVPALAGKLDVLFVDEAGQLPLAHLAGTPVGGRGRAWAVGVS